MSGLKRLSEIVNDVNDCAASRRTVDMSNIISISMCDVHYRVCLCLTVNIYMPTLQNWVVQCFCIILYACWDDACVT